MPLAEQTIEIPLGPLDQKPSDASGPVGRLTRLVNAYADKYRDGSFVRPQKRPGFQALAHLPTAFADPYTGGSVAGTGVPPSPSVVGSLGDRLFAIGSDSIPYVYSETSGAWEQFYKESILTAAPSLAPVYANTARIRCPDSAGIGAVTCYVWQQFDGTHWSPYVMILDGAGTVLRAPLILGNDAATARLKVVSDGVRFWVITDQGGANLTAFVFGADGSSQAAPSGTAVDIMFAASDTWDVTFRDDSIGVMLVRRGTIDHASSAGATLTHLTLSGGAVAVSQAYASTVTWGHTDAGTDIGGALLTSDFVADRIFLAVPTLHVDFTTDYTLSVYELDVNGTLLHTYQPIKNQATPAIGICNIAGFVDSDGTVHACVTHLPYTGGGPAENFQLGDVTANPHPTCMLTEHGSATAAADGLGFSTVRALGLASRAFQCQGIYVAVMYYPSTLDPATGQPTYFLVRPDTLQIVGRIAHGFAAADWMWGGPDPAGNSDWDGTTMPTPNAMQLTSPVLTNGIAIALGVQGEQSFAGSAQSGLLTVNRAVTAVGISSLTLGAPGDPLELPGEVLIPGPMARSWDGQSFGSSGIELDPQAGEQLMSVAPSGLGPYDNTMTIYFTVVYERVDARGRRVRSGSVAMPPWTPTGVGVGATLTIPTLRATTHGDVIISVYRALDEVTALAHGVTGLTHYKVTDDLNPIKNDPTVDSVSVSFGNNVPLDFTGEILYGGSGAFTSTTSTVGGDFAEVDHDPAPPFVRGCVFQDRALLIAYDGTVWFSLPQSNSSPSVWSEGLFQLTIPTNQHPTVLAPLDARAAILCDRSLWYVNSDSFLDATGAGDIPTPQQLPITHGGTGRAALTPLGLVYEATEGGFYLLGRDLSSSYIGAQVEDEVEGAAGVSAVAVDQFQRVYFALRGNGRFLVYDINFGGWYRWDIQTVPSAICAWKGALVFADGTDVMVSKKGTSSDVYTAATHPIVTTVGLAPIYFGDVQMLWELGLQFAPGMTGDLDVTVTYDQDPANTETFDAFHASDADGTGRITLQLAQPECSYAALTISDSFPGAPGPGWVLEKLIASVGVLPGPRRGGIKQRMRG